MTIVELLGIALRVAPVLGGIAIIAWRLQETRSPVTPRKILVPPLGMSTGFTMFVAPSMRIEWTWALAAFLVGFLILSYPLVRSSTLERRGDEVLMRRSNGFLLILLGLLGLRLTLHEYVGALVSTRRTAAVLFVLAFGMIVRWRWVLYRQYRALRRENSGTPAV